MNRRLLVFAMFAIPISLLLFALQMRVVAAPTGQLIRDPRPAQVAATPPGEPLSQPVTVTIRQQTPLTLALLLADQAELFGDLPPTIPVTVSFVFQLALTQTLTTTAPSSVTLIFPADLALNFPVSLSVGGAPSATVVVTAPAVVEEPSPTPTLNLTVTPPTPSPSPTEELTAVTGVTSTVTVTATASLTESVTPTATTTLTSTDLVSPTEPPGATAPALSSTVNITANLRAAPGVESAVIGQAGLGLPVLVTGVSADGLWYLLDSGAWIAVGLLDNAPANPRVADEAIITSVQATATARAANIPTTVAATPTPVGLLLPTPTATPPPVLPSVTVNANLRSGPGLEFPIIGGTIANQPVTIVARTESGEWFQLDNGGWVAAFLLANPPDLATVPIFGAEASPAETAPLTTTAPVTTTDAVTTGGAVTATTPATPTSPAALGVLDNLYLIDAAELIARYDRALGQIDALITQAGGDEALLQDEQWVREMTTAVALLRATDARARTLQPTALLEPVHTDLLAAASAYDSAATLIAQAVDQGDPDRFDEAFAAITRGNVSLGNATDQIDALTP